MAEIVNLRRVKKSRARADAARLAQTNRVLHGTPPALRQQAAAANRRTERRLDGARIDADDPGPAAE
ncbi:MAG: DUF4169 family protein [Rhodospirillales bacterium]|nr:DUF4169 family protein [Rhodospirillales bacterium]